MTLLISGSVLFAVMMMLYALGGISYGTVLRILLGISGLLVLGFLLVFTFRVRLIVIPLRQARSHTYLSSLMNPQEQADKEPKNVPSSPEVLSPEESRQWLDTFLQEQQQS